MAWDLLYTSQLTDIVIDQPMQKYRLICPNCSAAIFTGCPEAMIWEVCPACRRYMWDPYDARMADLITEQRDHERALFEGRQNN